MRVWEADNGSVGMRMSTRQTRLGLVERGRYQSEAIQSRSRVAQNYQQTYRLRHNCKQVSQYKGYRARKRRYVCLTCAVFSFGVCSVGGGLLTRSPIQDIVSGRAHLLFSAPVRKKKKSLTWFNLLPVVLCFTTIELPHCAIYRRLNREWEKGCFYCWRHVRLLMQ